MRLGFSISVLGMAGLPAYDAASQGDGDLSVSLAYLRDIFLYLRANHIHMYRLHCGVAASLLRRCPASWRDEIAACAPSLAALGDLARQGDIRLSFHPFSLATLNALNEEQLARSLAVLEAETELLDALGCGPEGLIVLHVGGVYDDIAASRERFIRRYHELPEPIRRRVALEHDDRRYPLSEALAIHRVCGIPLVFDNLHHLTFNPDRIPLREALAMALTTWPVGVAPKIHFSTPRTEMKLVGSPARSSPPRWTEHSDFVNPFAFADFLHLAESLREFDIMLEAKARDLALLRLREDVRVYTPEWAGRIV